MCAWPEFDLVEAERRSTRRPLIAGRSTGSFLIRSAATAAGLTRPSRAPNASAA